MKKKPAYQRLEVVVASPPDPQVVEQITELESVIDLQVRMLEAQTAVVDARTDLLANEAHLEQCAAIQLCDRTEAGQRNEYDARIDVAHAKTVLCTCEQALHALTVEATTRQIDVIRAQVLAMKQAAGIPIEPKPAC